MSVKERPATGPNPVSARPAAWQWLAVLRIAVGLIFLWAFVDKLVGLGYATPAAKSWLSGGSPTKGFLGNVGVGPFRSMFHAWAGAGWADWLFMLALLGIGLAVTLGVALRISAVAGTILLVLMWAAEWPLSTTTAAGAPSGSTNPLIDYHIVYALVLIVAALFGAGVTWGLGGRWERLAVVRNNPWLR
ncbi:DoxX family membrane protein [Kutzneria kofuensis]|uniref:Thiosulfate dehydrogenase [quinone] large subunit n=1 Tax=Kutzneria kofuensis TaxID=103725 RepID=A0A7W9NMG0_9PSEU|nr:DoxX family membrane protein [Kutzneria kofuensis]MBB5898085.1 thiosulfate dehydrogenase [quinone] large subunit [Kutzneria kofuensis]